MKDRRKQTDREMTRDRAKVRAAFVTAWRPREFLPRDDNNTKEEKNQKRKSYVWKEVKDALKVGMRKVRRPRAVAGHIERKKSYRVRDVGTNEEPRDSESAQ